MGKGVGLIVGDPVGPDVGVRVGPGVGDIVGPTVGNGVGSGVGAFVPSVGAAVVATGALEGELVVGGVGMLLSFPIIIMPFPIIIIIIPLLLGLFMSFVIELFVEPFFSLIFMDEDDFLVFLCVFWVDFSFVLDDDDRDSSFFLSMMDLCDIFFDPFSPIVLDVEEPLFMAFFFDPFSPIVIDVDEPFFMLFFLGIL